MHLTQEADYAIRIIYCLSKEARRCDANFISNDMEITLRFSLKILGKLAQKGLVKSFKGNKGGYELAKAPSEISVNDVLVAIDGEYQLSRCVHDAEYCNRNATSYCKFNKLFLHITENVTDMLSKATFDKFIS